eukprot:3395810-Rhodomonas_salina.3
MHGTVPRTNRAFGRARSIRSTSHSHRTRYAASLQTCYGMPGTPIAYGVLASCLRETLYSHSLWCDQHTRLSHELFGTFRKMEARLAASGTAPRPLPAVACDPRY